MLLTRGFELVTHGLELVTRELKLVTRGFELVTRGFELVTRGFELVTRILLFHILKLAFICRLQDKSMVGYSAQFLYPVKFLLALLWLGLTFLLL